MHQTTQATQATTASTAPTTAQPAPATTTPLKGALRGVDFAAGEAALAPVQLAGAKPAVDKPVAPGTLAPATLDESTARLEGQLLVSNNPEEIYIAGIVLKDMVMRPGNAALYIHHFNRQGRNMARPGLEFYAIVRPKGATPTRVGWNVAATGGGYTGRETYNGKDVEGQDVNARTSKKALDLKRPGAGTELTGPQVFKVGGVPPSGAPLLLDARANLDIAGGEVLVDIVCCQPGGKPLEVKTMALGSTKMKTSDTLGRPAGVYEGAMLIDQRRVAVANMSGPLLYPLTAGTTSKAVPTPKATQQKKATIYDNVVTRILNEQSDPANTRLKGDVAAQTVAIEGILASAYQVSATWLRDMRIIQNGRFVPPKRLVDRIDPKTKKPVLDAKGDQVKDSVDNWLHVASDPSFHRMINDLRVQIECGWAQRTWAGVLDHLHGYDTIGAATDAANYGTIYEVGFELDNTGGAAAQVKVALFNDNKLPFRGAIRLDGQDVFVSKEKVGKGDDATAYGAIALGAPKAVAAGAKRQLALRMMSPGQIETGQLLQLERVGAPAPKGATKPA